MKVKRAPAGSQQGRMDLSPVDVRNWILPITWVSLEMDSPRDFR